MSSVFYAHTQKQTPPILVPNTPSSMMRKGIFTKCFQLLHLVVQEEVYQDSVDMPLGVESLDLPPNQLNAPDATG